MVSLIKDHASLCACTLGIVLLGYLGYRTVQMNNNKCDKTKKIDGAAQDTLSKKNSYIPPIKINSSGKFLRFPGVTVISSIGEKNSEIWKDLYQELNKSQLIQKYYSLLPSESYHLTTINLYTEKNDGGIHWGLFIEKELPWFQRLNDELHIREFQPKITVVKAIVGRSALLLLVELDSNQVKKNLDLAQAFSLEKKIPEEFHITLGYPYKDIPNGDRKKIEEETQKIVEKILRSGSSSFDFKEPELCYFTDMTKFLPWDGRMNPFSEAKLSDLSKSNRQ